MEKMDPDAENVARSAADLTVLMAEERLGVRLAYRTYTAESYQDKTYDEVALDRARNNMDDQFNVNRLCNMDIHTGVQSCLFILGECVRRHSDNGNASGDLDSPIGEISLEGLRFLAAEDNDINAEILAEIGYGAGRLLRWGPCLPQRRNPS